MDIMRFLRSYFVIAGILTFGLCIAVFSSLARAGGSGVFWITVTIAVAVYLVAQILCWYFLLTRLMRRMKKSRIIFSVFGMTFFILWMERFSFLLFGCCEGVPLFQPLIFALPHLFFRVIVAKMGTFFSLLLFHYMVLVVATGGRFARFMAILIVFVCGALGRYVFHSGVISPPDWIERCVVVRPPFVPGVSIEVFGHVQGIAHELAGVHGRWPGRDLIFMPESAVPFALEDYAAAREAFASLSLGRTIFFGAHRAQESVRGRSVFNAALCFVDGELFFWRDKTHGMVGVERLPGYLQCGWIMRGLGPLLGSGFFVQADCADAGRWAVCDLSGMSVLPLLCSEFFYSHRIQASCTVIVLALVNDAWFKRTPIPYVLWCCARYKAVRWKRTILYVSYDYAGLFDAAGNWFEI